MIEERFCEGSPTITCAALIQYLVNNEAKRNIQINEDIGVIKIISCGSYVFLNNEHCGYWRGKIGFFSINLAHIPDLIQPEPIPYKMQPLAFMCLSLTTFVLI